MIMLIDEHDQNFNYLLTSRMLHAASAAATATTLLRPGAKLPVVAPDPRSPFANQPLASIPAVLIPA
jgi:hypothetical protein